MIALSFWLTLACRDLHAFHIRDQVQQLQLVDSVREDDHAAEKYLRLSAEIDDLEIAMERKRCN